MTKKKKLLLPKTDKGMIKKVLPPCHMKLNHLKISKSVFLKLLLHKSSWDSVLNSFNTPLFAGGF